MGRAAHLRIEKEFGFPHFLEALRQLLAGSFPEFKASQTGEGHVKISEGVTS
jgi:hypothetical protein